MGVETSDYENGFLKETTERYPLGINCGRLSWLPLVAFVAIVVVSYSDYAIQGKWIGYLPTISAASCGYPNVAGYSTVMIANALILGTLIELYISFAKLEGHLGRWFTFCLRPLGYLCPPLLIVLSSVTLEDNPSVHRASTFFFLALFASLTFIAFFGFLSHASLLLNLTRGVILVIVLVLLALYGFIPQFCSTFLSVASTTATFEIAFLVLLLTLVLLWKEELRGLSLNVALL